MSLAAYGCCWMRWASVRSGGKYVPLLSAKLLASAIIGGCREEIQQDKLAKEVKIELESSKPDLSDLGESSKHGGSSNAPTSSPAVDQSKSTFKQLGGWIWNLATGGKLSNGNVNNNNNNNDVIRKVAVEIANRLNNRGKKCSPWCISFNNYIQVYLSCN